MIRDWGGCFAADVVGLGKSYIGAAVVKHFERTEHNRPVIICPAGLVEMFGSLTNDETSYGGNVTMKFINSMPAC